MHAMAGRADSDGRERLVSFGSQAIPTATVDELRRMAACRRAGCLACLLDGMNGGCGPVEYHHFKLGGRVAGHRHGIALGIYHHQGRKPITGSFDEIAAKFGPSLARNPRAFHARYGSNQELQDAQDKRIGWAPVPIQRQKGPGIGQPTFKTKHKNGSATSASRKTIPRGQRGCSPESFGGE